VQLQFFSKSEIGQLNEVDHPSAMFFDDFVGDRQDFQVFINQ
jgi:hypothetical protein